jgi:ABC-type transport system involved in cytochrome bd biosynthesis fused ATPase/permease subunit
MSFELMFWAMTMGVIIAIFMCGVLLGAWLAWRYLAPRETVDMKKTKSIADMEAHIEDLTNKIEELTAMSRRHNTEVAQNQKHQVAKHQVDKHQVFYVARDGVRFHVKPDCNGLSGTKDKDITTKTACRICVW